MFWDFVNRKITSESLLDFLSSVYLDVPVTVFASRSAANLLLVHNEIEYPFSSDDLSWLTFSGAAFVCKTGFDYDIFCMEVYCLPSEYYMVCAALVKLFSKTFPQKKIFLFQIDCSIVFGCERNLSGKADGDFCITKQFDGFSENEANEFLLGLTLIDTEDIPWLIAQYSPQEQQDVESTYDWVDLNPDYLRFLDELSSFYGVNTVGERRRYICFFEEQRSHKITHQEAKKLLSGVAGAEDISSYDILDAAITAEEKYTSDEQYETIVSLPDNMPDSFSPEAFLKADVMLDEMLKQQ